MKQNKTPGQHRFVVITFFKYSSCFAFLSPLSHELFITQHYDSAFFPRVALLGSVLVRGHFSVFPNGTGWIGFVDEPQRRYLIRRGGTRLGSVRMMSIPTLGSVYLGLP